MNENFIEAQYDITKKSRLKRIYDSYKTFIYSLLIILIISIISAVVYSNYTYNKNTKASEKYLIAKIHLSEGRQNEAKTTLKKLVYLNNATYSSLAFFLILNQNLISDKNEIEAMFDHILKNNDFDKEVKNLLIYKRLLYSSDYINESDLLKDIKPLLNDSNAWKPHALLLAGDYFFANKEGQKAVEFYQEVLSIKNLQKNLYDHALYQLVLIKNDLQ